MSTNTSSDTSGVKRSGHPFSGGTGLVLFILLVGAAGWLTYKTLWVGTTETTSGRAVMFVCSESNKAFEHIVKEGQEYPVLSPYTNRNTGYPAEECYWTKDGKQKEKPTYVILNSRLDKTGDTICPDCGRVVVGHNPRPPEGTPVAGP